MAENSKIEWTTHTFNPWRGCTKVAAGCANCYADNQAKRNPGTLGIWGDNGTRVVASEAMWKEPLKWDKQAAAAGERHRVFCASMADVFEDWTRGMMGHNGGFLHHAKAWKRGEGYCEVADMALGKSRVQMADVRARLFSLIDETPNLDWLLLTKRPQNIRKMIPDYSYNACATGDCPHQRASECSKILDRDNVWLGTSIATQEDADRNIPELLKCRDLVPVLFLSIEPLLGPVPDPRPLSPLDFPTSCRSVHNRSHLTTAKVVRSARSPRGPLDFPRPVRSVRDQAQILSRSATMSDRITLASSLTEHLEDQLTAQRGPRGIFDLQGSIAEWVQDNAKRIVDEKIDTVEERTAIREVALTVFDKWDVPYIDGFVETAVKSALRPGLAAIVDGLLGFSHELLA